MTTATAPPNPIAKTADLLERSLLTLRAELEAIPDELRKAKQGGDGPALTRLREREELLPVLIKRAEISILERDIAERKTAMAEYTNQAEPLAKKREDAAENLKQAQQAFLEATSAHRNAVGMAENIGRVIDDKMQALRQAKEALERM